MKVLIVEDDDRVAEVIRRGLEEQGFQTVLAYDGITGKKLAMQNEFDFVITDIILPKLNGIDLCREIRQMLPEIPIIMLTALGTTDDKIEGFDAGADDYLVKPFEMRELIVRMRVLIKRNFRSTEPVGFMIHFADLEMNIHTKTVKRGEQDIHLTAKEFKLLEFMMQNPGRVLSRTEIAEKVWDTNFDTGTNFIDVYINYLRKKIDKDFEHKLIHTKLGMGFILKLDE